jgi:RNA polymerase sigma-70 factor, ECF subfamily
MDLTTSPTHHEAAFACVAAAWQAHEGELLGFLRHQLPDGHAAEDLLQDVFVKAMRQGQGFCGLDNPRAWLFQVARNAVIDRARVSKVDVPLDEVALDIPAPIPEAIAPIDALAGCMARMLAELPPDDAAILRACDLEGRTQREFAELQGLSLPAAKSRLLRARQRLREQLSTACQVRFDDDGSVSGHVPRPPITG